MIRFLRIEAVCRCGVRDDGVVKVTEGNVGNSSLRFTEHYLNCDSASLITGTSLTHQLGVIHLLHTGRREEMKQGEETWREEGKTEERRREEGGKKGTRREQIRAQGEGVNMSVRFFLFAAGGARDS